LSEFLSQNDKIFGKNKQVGEDVFFIEAGTSKPSIESSRGIGAKFSNIGCVIKISQHIGDKVKDEVKEEKEVMAKEEETKIINEVQTNSKEVNQKDLEIIVISMVEADLNQILC
jgi:hypothetical protein